MKIKHRNISNSTGPTVLLGAGVDKISMRTIQSLLISNSISSASTVSVYIQALHKAAGDKQQIFGVEDGASFSRYNNAFHIIKNLTVPKHTAVDLFASFPKGFSYNSNYELVIVLGDVSHSVSTILAYE